MAEGGQVRGFRTEVESVQSRMVWFNRFNLSQMAHPLYDRVRALPPLILPICMFFRLQGAKGRGWRCFYTKLLLLPTNSPAFFFMSFSREALTSLWTHSIDLQYSTVLTRSPGIMVTYQTCLAPKHKSPYRPSRSHTRLSVPRDTFAVQTTSNVR